MKDGAPLANLPLRLDGRLVQDGFGRKARTDANGKFVFKGVAPDDYQLRSILKGTSECSEVPEFEAIPNNAEDPDKATAVLLFGKHFTVRAGERVVKDIIASC